MATAFALAAELRLTPAAILGCCGSGVHPELPLCRAIDCDCFVRWIRCRLMGEAQLRAPFRSLGSARAAERLESVNLLRTRTTCRHLAHTGVGSLGRLVPFNELQFGLVIERLSVDPAVEPRSRRLAPAAPQDRERINRRKTLYPTILSRATRNKPAAMGRVEEDAIRIAVRSTCSHSARM